MQDTDREGVTEVEEAASSGGGDGLYPIRTVSALTGVNPVTLRAWERRYGLIRPQRTPKGHRLYTEADIDRIQHILELLDQGIPIGQTRRLIDSEEALPRNAVSEGGDSWAAYRTRVFDAVSRYDERALEALHVETMSVFSLEQCMNALWLPTLRELRLEWLGNTVRTGEALLLNTFLRNKLGAQIHHLVDLPRGPRLLLAGLPGECECAELNLLCISAIRQGFRATLVGGNFPLGALAATAERARARGVVLFGHTEDAAETVHARAGDIVRELNATVFLGGQIVERHPELPASVGAHGLPGVSSQSVNVIYERLGS